MKGKESHCAANFATFVYISIGRGCNKVVIELSGVQLFVVVVVVVVVVAY